VGQGLRQITAYGVDDSEIVIVAPPKNIEKEWRFIVCEGKVLTGSLYKSGGGVNPLE
jgi:hypothetical protein